MQHFTFPMSCSYQIDATSGWSRPVIDRLARYGADVLTLPRRLAAVIVQHLLGFARRFSMITKGSPQSVSERGYRNHSFTNRSFTNIAFATSPVARVAVA